MAKQTKTNTGSDLNPEEFKDLQTPENTAPPFEGVDALEATEDELAKDKQERIEGVDALEATEDELAKDKQERKVKTIVSGAEYHNFETTPIFIGKYIKNVLREKDGGEGKPTGQTIGYLMVSEDGEETIIGNSNGIEKALHSVVDEGPDKGKIFKDCDVTFYIEFLGKIVLANGKPYNRFKVGTV